MFETLVLAFEIIGTIAFAVSGAMTGLKKNMDILGVTLLGLVTAVGGGVIRDLVLGITPPATFCNPTYALVAICAAIIVFFPFVQKMFNKNYRIYDLTMLIMDSLGLGIFTVIGIRTAYGQSSDHSIFLLVFVGVITGVGGGILRDILAGNTPYVFVKHFYACASIIGALVCCLVWNFTGEVLAMITGSVVVIVLRFLAAHFRWSLPKSKVEN
ncbi:MAG: trimeric intracellular cation channel family protein [Ruminococcaceae bacterium]|nr:trimeric intracellular cation channel family protein [Oscillospiraceae bacterium]